MHQQKNFISRNDGFLCDHCGLDIPPAKGTFRNHCPHCLTSKHVDEHIPGDRLSACEGLMPVQSIEGTNPDELDLIHCCQKCGKISRNRTAPDDNKKALFALMENK